MQCNGLSERSFHVPTLRSRTRRSQDPAAGVCARPGADPRADPEYLHSARALRRLDGNPHGDRASLGSDRGGARVRGLPRRYRWPHRAAAEGIVALRRRARFPRRLRQFRRGAGDHHLHLGARRFAQHGLDRRARFRCLRGAEARALQRGAGANRSAGLEEQLFRRGSGAGGRDRATAADLCAGSRPAPAEPHPARASLYASHRAFDGEPGADLLRQADRPANPT